jgi:DNA mismatch repair protein MutS2
MSLALEDVDILTASEAAVVLSSQPRSNPRAKSYEVSSVAAPAPQIDLRGMRYDDAMSELERYLDQAFRGGGLEVTIIHGLGTGAIREGARKLIGKLPYIKTFRDSGLGQGGAGATLVEFDR